MSEKNELSEENKKENEEILNFFLKFSKDYRKDLQLFEKYVNFYKDKYKIDIDIVYIHSDEEDVTKIKGDDYFSDDDWLEKMKQKTGNDEIDSEPQALIDKLYKKNDKPRGIIIVLLDKQNNLQHAEALIIDKQDEQNKKPIILLEDNDILDEQSLPSFLMARTLEKDDKQMSINKHAKVSRNLSTLLNDFNWQLMKPYICQTTNICFILATMFCVEILKNNAQYFNKCINSDSKKRFVVPFSYLRYTQSNILLKMLQKQYDEYDDEYGYIYKYLYKDIDNKTKEKCIKDIKESMITYKGEPLNIFAMKKLFKWLKKHYWLHAGYDDIITGIINGNLTNEQIRSLDSKVSLAEELKKYNVLHNNIIERKGLLSKAFSFGENNAKIRRINQLAKIMNNEFTKNMAQAEKAKFKSQDKQTREMKEITNADLMNISNIHASCGCTSSPNVIE